MKSIGKVGEIWRYPVKSTRGEQLKASRVGSKGLAGDRGWAVRDDKAGELRGGRHLPKLLQCRSRYRSEPASEPWPPAWITTPTGAEFASDDPDAGRQLSEWMGTPVSLWPIQPPEDLEHYRRLPMTEQELIEQFAREPGEPLPDLQMFPQELMHYVSHPGTYFDVQPVHLLTTASLEHMRSLNAGADWAVQRFRPNIVVDTGSLRGLIEAGWTGRTIRIGEVELSVYSPAPRCAN
ncbi:MAG: MOSC N-terminal beta barrel domain-containing protein, partial [Gammaproteobacteria bacterium]